MVHAAEHLGFVDAVGGRGSLKSVLDDGCCGLFHCSVLSAGRRRGSVVGEKLLFGEKFVDLSREFVRVLEQESVVGVGVDR